jgi:xylan 1,4-beta-xylosidase
VTRLDGIVVRLIKRAAGVEQVLAVQPFDVGRFFLKVDADGQAYSFYVAVEPGEWRPLAEAVDGRILSTPVAGGFTGTYIGMYASSNGLLSSNRADFDWFAYTGLQEP